MLATSYFQHFVLHHFTMCKCIMMPCTIIVQTLRGPILCQVLNLHIFRYKRSNLFKFGDYVEGSVAIHLFSSLICILSVMEIRLCKLMHIFPLDSAKKFPHTLRFAKMIGAKRPGKCASTSHSSISVMDKAKINEQNKSIVTGPYTYTPNLIRFERSYLKM